MLDINAIIHEPSGASRNKWPLIIGLPFASGVLGNPTPIAISDSAQRPLLTSSHAADFIAADENNTDYPSLLEEQNALRLVAYHFRRLNNDTLSAQHTLQKTQLYLDALDKKMKNPTIHQAHDQRRNQRPQQTRHLKASLPKGVLPRLKRCQALRAENTVRKCKMLHELYLMDRVSEGLKPLSLLLVHSPKTRKPNAPSRSQP